MNRILLIGSLAYDRIMVFPGLFKEHFLPEGLHNINVSFSVSTPKIVFGGCAGNIGYSLALLGGSPEILATAGNDFADYEEHLKENGIATTGIEIINDLPTASCYITTDKADNQITAFSAGADEQGYTLPFETARASLAIVSPTGIEDMRRFPERFREAGVPYLFDPGQQIPMLSGEDLRSAITGALGLIVNDYELALVLEKTGWSEQDIIDACQTLIVTLGEQGSRVRTGNDELTVPAVPANEVVDPTGAGDAFRAGLLHGLSSGISLEESLRLASTVATYAVECYGTQNHRFTLDELTARYESTYQSPFPL